MGLGWLRAFLVLLACGAIASAQSTPTVLPKQSIEGTLDPSQASVVAFLDLIDTEVVTISVGAKKSLLRPEFKLYSLPGLDEVASSVPNKSGKKSSLNKFTVTSSGSYLLEIRGTDAGAYGAFKGSVKRSLTKALKAPPSSGPSEAFTFEASSGSTLTGKVILSTSGEFGSDWLRIDGPGGPVVVSVKYSKDGRVAQIKKTQLPGFGLYTIRGEGPVGELLSVDPKVKIKVPKAPKGALKITGSLAKIVSAKPVLDAHPTHVQTESITLTGTATGASVVATSPAGMVSSEVVGGTFEIEVPLKLNVANKIFLRTLPTKGLPSPLVSTTVVVDEQPPMLAVLFPPDGTQFVTETISVSGIVGDSLSSTFGPGLQVSVNGQAATVVKSLGTNGTFELPSLNIGSGMPTQIDVVATDGVGNMRSTAITVRYSPPAASDAVLSKVSGDGQTASQGSKVSQPLTVKVTAPGNQPLVNKIVTFRVKRSDGVLLPTSSASSGGASLQVSTDATGTARVWWRLGGDAGVGNNRVEVTAKDVKGTAYFCATAKALPASRIEISSGNNQRTGAGLELPLPLVVRVTDKRNPLPGVAVRFDVQNGLGSFDGAGLSTYETVTDELGLASTPYFTGDLSGLNVVQATIVGVSATAASFHAFATEAVAGTATSFSGVVLDNGSRPVLGAKCLLRFPGVALLEATTSASGRFEFEGITHDGIADLSVEGTGAIVVGVDGRQANVGALPSLHFENIAIVKATANAMAMPVLLPELRSVGTSYTGETAVELVCEGIDGLKITVAPNSVRVPVHTMLPDGTETVEWVVPSVTDPITLSIDQVHYDEIPMPLPDGASTLFAATFQPAGAVFDPPAKFEMPNINGLSPGSIVNLMSFDHGTGKFEVVGTGSVRDDGALVVSDPGSGLALGGWHAAPPPPPPPCKIFCCKPASIWELAKSGLKLAYEIAKIFLKIDDAVDCALGVIDSIETCADTIADASEDGELTTEDLPAIIACLKSIKDTATTCADLAPEPAAEAKKAQQFIGVLNAAIEAALASNCPPKGLAIALKAVQLLTNAVNEILTWVVDNGSVKDLIIGIVCQKVQAYLDALEIIDAGSFAGDETPSVEEILQGLAESKEAMLSALGILDAMHGLYDEDFNALLVDVQDEFQATIDEVPTFPELAGCIVSAGGQSGPTDAAGWFELDNVPSGDVPIAVNMLCEGEDGTLYAQSSFFQPLANGEFEISDSFVLSETPPPVPVTVDLEVFGYPAGEAIALELGQQATLTVWSNNNDETITDVTGLAHGTWLTTTNPDIVSVDTVLGKIVGNSLGTAYVTAANQGATVVRRVDVVVSTLTDAVQGHVLFADGTPAAAASVTSLYGSPSSSDGDGFFAMPITLPSDLESLLLRAALNLAGVEFLGSKGVDTDDFSDAGIIEVFKKCTSPVWSALSTGLDGPSFCSTSGTLAAQQQPRLYVGGAFASAGGLSVGSLSAWSGGGWTNVGGGVHGWVNDVLIHDDGSGLGDCLYVAGVFDGAGPLSTSGIARWDGTQWYDVGGGIEGSVDALQVVDLGKGPFLVAAGSFEMAGGVAAANIAAWDGEGWAPLGSGTNGWVHALEAFDPPGAMAPRLVVGGSFTTAGGQLALHLAQFDGNWSPLGGGASNDVYALETHDDGSGVGPLLYVGGAFTSVGTTQASGIARYDGSAWSALAQGVSGTVRSLLSFDDSAGTGPRLYVGGAFGKVGTVTTNNVGRWSANTWSAVPGGVNGTVQCLSGFRPTFLPAPMLYVGGSFSTANGVPAIGVAAYGCLQ